MLESNTYFYVNYCHEKVPQGEGDYMASMLTPLKQTLTHTQPCTYGCREKINTSYGLHEESFQITTLYTKGGMEGTWCSGLVVSIFTHSGSSLPTQVLLYKGVVFTLKNRHVIYLDIPTCVMTVLFSNTTSMYISRNKSC